MWTWMSESLHRIWLALHTSAQQRKIEKERARFWADLREGQDEADIAFRN